MPWIRLGETEFNLARRYSYADDAIDGETTVIAGKLGGGLMPSSSLYDSSALTPLPARLAEAMTCMNAVDEGFMPEPQSYPDIKAMVDDLFAAIKSRSLRPRDKIDEIMDQITLDGETFARIGDKTYRFTVGADGMMRSELVYEITGARA